MRRIRERLTYANVISTICLFLLLGGGAYAAFHLPKNSVRSPNIVNGQVKRGDQARNQRTEWALVKLENPGEIIAQSGGISIDERTGGGGRIDLNFHHDISHRAIVATSHTGTDANVDATVCGESSSEEDIPCNAEAINADNHKHVYVEARPMLNTGEQVYVAVLPK